MVKTPGKVLKPLNIQQIELDYMTVIVPTNG